MMKSFGNILLLIGIFTALNGYTQNDDVIKNDRVNIATLVVDYDSYNFEGGDISYYSCANCPNDSIPFSIDYAPPGDFGGITFQLSSLKDTVFNASIIWMGKGQIIYPTGFKNQAPFSDINIATNRPKDYKYIAWDGTMITDPQLIDKADSAWNAIDSLKITKSFADKGFQSGIYLYPPTVGAFNPNVAKWIVFLYHKDQSSSTNKHFQDKEQTQVRIFPNPTNGADQIKLSSPNKQIANYKLFNASGQVVDREELLNSDSQIDVSMLKSGLYWLQLSNENNKAISTEKIMVE